MKYMLGSVIVEEVGLNVSDLENQARAKPSHPVFLQKRNLSLIAFLSLPQRQRTPLENSTTKKVCHPRESALCVTEIAKTATSLKTSRIVFACTFYTVTALQQHQLTKSVRFDVFLSTSV